MKTYVSIQIYAKFLAVFVRIFVYFTAFIVLSTLTSLQELAAEKIPNASWCTGFAFILNK